LASCKAHRCEAEPGALDEGSGFVCSTCRTVADTFSAQLAALRTLQAGAISRLDALDRPAVPAPAPGTATLVFAEGLPVTDPAAVDSLADKLRQVLAQELRVQRQVC
jgi:hypothetical protein